MNGEHKTVQTRSDALTEGDQDLVVGGDGDPDDPEPKEAR
jgi:hypothetical protein